MPLLVRLRPNRQYLLLLALVTAVLVLGLVIGGGLGVAIAGGSGVLLVLVGYPIVASTLLQVPVVAVEDVGIRLPLLGVRLLWPAVAAVTTCAGPRPGTSLLLIVPVNPPAVVRQTRPWLRREARGNLARYGTPIVLSDLTLDHSLDEIAVAVRQRLEDQAGR